MWAAPAIRILCCAAAVIQLDAAAPVNESASALSLDEPVPASSRANHSLPSLNVHLKILRQMRERDLLPRGDGLGLTLYGDFAPDMNLPSSLLNESVTLRACRRCQRRF